MNSSPLLIVVVFNFVINYATGLYFHLGEGEHKCFIEEVPSDTIVTCKPKLNNLCSSNSVYNDVLLI